MPCGIADTINGGGLSAGGRYVAYDLRKEEAYKGLYVKDVDTGQARRADTSADGTAGDGYSALVHSSMTADV
ncbi:hypothetical protein MBT84_48760 [Streptomyces sp. MBT84]|uniref:hypothetical protein n=1 Tax=unclassified Streptomyces TaxID=2593676 RepID=UPI001C6E5C60|nr:hypothetical protein [Streptomyces sp. MBT84]MBW8707555.1 hypothetical protein [Streptomyces sp. MBT84]